MTRNSVAKIISWNVDNLVMEIGYLLSMMFS